MDTRAVAFGFIRPIKQLHNYIEVDTLNLLTDKVLCEHTAVLETTQNKYGAKLGPRDLISEKTTKTV